MPKIFRFELNADLFEGDPQSIAQVMLRFANGLVNCPYEDIRDDETNGKRFRAEAKSLQKGVDEPFAGMYVIEAELDPSMRIPDGEAGAVEDVTVQTNGGRLADDYFGEENLERMS